MDNRNKLAAQVRNALFRITRLDVPNILDICTYTAIIAVLEFESKTLSSAENSYAIAHAVELDNMIKEYKIKLEELKQN